MAHTHTYTQHRDHRHHGGIRKCVLKHMRSTHGVVQKVCCTCVASCRLFALHACSRPILCSACLWRCFRHTLTRRGWGIGFLGGSAEQPFGANSVSVLIAVRPSDCNAPTSRDFESRPAWKHHTQHQAVEVRCNLGFSGPACARLSISKSPVWIAV